MENIIEEFLKDGLYDKYSYGSGSGSGDLCGDGYGSGKLYGYDSGSGSGYGSGYGNGNGEGYGYGSGSGGGFDSGYGYGSGGASGYYKDISKFNNDKVYLVDDVPTIIKKVKGNIARGCILNGDFTLQPCYIAKGHNKFAHGKTIRKAVKDLQSKIFEDMDTDEAIELFLQEFELDKRYKGKDFYIWHNRLTGSCEMGRQSFVKNKGIDLENDMFTVQEFIDLTRNDFGGNIIEQLEKTIKKECTE